MVWSGICPVSCWLYYSCTVQVNLLFSCTCNDSSYKIWKCLKKNWNCPRKIDSVRTLCLNTCESLFQALILIKGIHSSTSHQCIQIGNINKVSGCDVGQHSVVGSLKSCSFRDPATMIHSVIRYFISEGENQFKAKLTNLQCWWHNKTTEMSWPCES